MHHIPLLVLALGAIAATVPAAEFHLSPTGNDAWPGSATAPWRTLTRAQASVQPGDVVTLLPGDHFTASGWTLGASGTAGAWITYRSAAPRQARITVTGNGYDDALRVTGAYIAIEGLSITAVGGLGHGIHVYYGHHVRIRDCLIEGMGGSGIQCNYADSVTVEDCLLRFNTYRNPFHCSGFSTYHPISRSDEPRPRFIVRRTMSHGNDTRFSDHLANPYYTDGNGFIIDDFINTQNGRYPDWWPDEALRGQQLPPYQGGALIENCLAADNGGRGIHALNSDHVTFRFNTVYGNNRRDLDGTWQGDLSSQSGANGLIEGNLVIAFQRSFPNQALMLGTTRGPEVTTVYRNNLLVGHTAMMLSSGYAVDGGGNITRTSRDGVCVAPGPDPLTASFRLAAGSPAIDAGGSGGPADDLAGFPRPWGGAWDIGAFERTAVNGAPVITHPAQAAAPVVVLP